MSRLVAWVDWLEGRVTEVESALLRSLVAIVFCLTFAQVVCRYVLNSPLVWTEEFVLYLFVWIVMVGAAAALRTHGHFSLNTFVTNLPPRAAAAVALIVDLAIAVFAAILLVQGINMTIGGLTEEASSFSLSMSWFYLSMPVGGALMLWHIFARVVRTLCCPDRLQTPEVEVTETAQ